jgi:uncharacterized protein (DUF3084 family)
MGERTVELGEKEFEQIGEYVKTHIEEWVEEVRKKREFDLLERIVRVEEELKSLHTLTTERFEAVEKRFEAIDRRFEEVEKRFEAIDRRFEAIDKRFEAMNKRFEEVDRRFEAMQSNMNERFEAVDKRFEMMQSYMDKRFSSLQWTMGIGFTLIAALMGVFNFF